MIPVTVAQGGNHAPERVFFPSFNVNASLLHLDPWLLCACVWGGVGNIREEHPSVGCIALPHEFMHHYYNADKSSMNWWCLMYWPKYI